MPDDTVGKAIEEVADSCVEVLQWLSSGVDHERPVAWHLDRSRTLRAPTSGCVVSHSACVLPLIPALGCCFLCNTTYKPAGSVGSQSRSSPSCSVTRADGHQLLRLAFCLVACAWFGRSVGGVRANSGGVFGAVCGRFVFSGFSGEAAPSAAGGGARAARGRKPGGTGGFWRKSRGLQRREFGSWRARARARAARSPAPPRRTTSDRQYYRSLVVGGTMVAGQKIAWCFTINNPTDEDDPRVWEESGCVRYCVWQRECGHGATDHFQGYVVFKRNHGKTLGGVKRLNSRAHWEYRHGTHEQARDYCLKEDTRVAGPWSFGEDFEGGSGARNDLVSLKRKLDGGASEKDVAQDEETFGAWLRYHNGVQRYLLLRSENRRSCQTTCVVYWGLPGSGKSTRAALEAGDEAYWVSKPPPSGALWFDGYVGQEVVVLDDFDGSWTTPNYMCRLIDRWAFMVKVHGGQVSFMAKKVIITSNVEPRNWWRNGLGGVARRLEPPIGSIVCMEEVIAVGDQLSFEELHAARVPLPV